MEDSMTRKTQNKKVTKVLRDFSQNTSLHGIRFLGENDVHIWRRFIWFALFCGSAGILIYQISDRIIYYYQRPVSINVKINYNKSITFPAVTICNQNAFKATLAAERKWYRLLEEMYKDGDMSDVTDLDQYNASQVKLDKLYLQTAHRKEDFIMECRWKNKPCDMDSFTQVITDHGVCYTFATKKDSGSVLVPGLEEGLKLILNIEQYEYMPGPHNAVGIKMFVHRPGEFPLVHSLGQAISAGNHVFAGVKLNVVNNLPPPYGDCGYEYLEHVEVYSSQACRLHCKNRIFEETCNCTNAYLSNQGSLDVCTLKQYIDCLKRTKGHVDVWNCDCPVPCSFQIYENELSYASSSFYSIDQLLDAEDIIMLEHSLLRAREISARMDPRIFGKTERLIKSFEKEFSNLQYVVTRSLASSVDSLLRHLMEEGKHTEDLYRFKERLFRYQIYNVEKNLVRARDLVEERTCDAVTLAYIEFGIHIENSIINLINETDPDIRRIYFISAVDKIETRKQIVERCKGNYTWLRKAYKKADLKYSYKFENISRSHNDISVPRTLIKSSLKHNEYATRYSKLLTSRTGTINRRLSELQQEVLNAFEGNSTTKGIDIALQKFYYSIRRFLSAKFSFGHEVIEYPIRVLKKRLASFKTLWNQINTNIDQLIQNVRSMKDEIKTETKTLFFINENVNKILQYYLWNGNISKYTAAIKISSKNITSRISNLLDFFDQAKVREQQIKDTLARTQEKIIEFWKGINQDVDSIQYYEFVNKTELTRNFSEILDDIDKNFTLKFSECNFAKAIHNIDELFSRRFEEVSQDLIVFKNSIQVKSDEFLRQLSYEQIDQQEAYDIISLLCDIGGSMGLFIGASVLSLFELLDFVMAHSLFNIRKKL